MQNSSPSTRSTSRRTTRCRSYLTTGARPTIYATVRLSSCQGWALADAHYPVWSNFEIADMDFWRGEAYQTFFDFLESKGGFYYERWGDAPVHSIAVALFVPRHRLHFFTDIGYRHTPFQHCPQADQWSQNKCSCNQWDTLGAYSPSSFCDVLSFCRRCS
jgi:hypothetical protein